MPDHLTSHAQVLVENSRQELQPGCALKGWVSRVGEPTEDLGRCSEVGITVDLTGIVQDILPSAPCAYGLTDREWIMLAFQKALG